MCTGKDRKEKHVDSQTWLHAKPFRMHKFIWYTIYGCTSPKRIYSQPCLSGICWDCINSFDLEKLRLMKGKINRSYRKEDLKRLSTCAIIRLMRVRFRQGWLYVKQTDNNLECFVLCRKLTMIADLYNYIIKMINCTPM